MKKLFYTSFSLIAIVFALTSCETVIHPELQKAEDVLVVDAWINNKAGAQTIKVMMTQPYFDSTLPPGVSGATVQVENLTSGKVMMFNESSTKGDYVWNPATTSERVGNPGDEFRLTILAKGETYEALSYMGRVPVIDSITFKFEEKNAFLPDSYIAEFWATDPAGSGDTYWIRATRNDTLLNNAGDINLAFDAGFSAGGNFDGVDFIPPIRQGISPYDTKDNKILSPYEPGDSVYVEINSITIGAFNYLTEVVTQADREGGFAELFATPLANVSTNINNANPNGKKAVGFFNVAAISGAGKRLKK